MENEKSVSANGNESSVVFIDAYGDTEVVGGEICGNGRVGREGGVFMREVVVVVVIFGGG